MRKRFTPYQITHLQLASAPLSSRALAEGMGNYVVFWWNEYPLGDLYLKPSQAISEECLLKECLASICPALVEYRRKFRRNALSIEEAELSWDALAAELEATFKDVKRRSGADADISVIICTRNRPQVLPDTLKSLLEMEWPAREIIVVDNAPSNDATEKVVRSFRSIRYVREPRPGLDVARNRGIASAASSIVAFVDDDAIVHPLWALQMARAFGDPTVSAVAGLVLASELQTEAQFIFESYWSFNRGFIAKRYTREFIERNRAAPVWKIGAGANMAFRKSVFKAAGYFDERLDAGAAGCNGDSEMWFRALAAGYTIAYDPLPVVYHQHRREIRELRQQLYNYLRGFTVAALIQHAQMPQAGYGRELLWETPRRYLRHVVRGFPRYESRRVTLAYEVRGVLAGLCYYYRCRGLRSDSVAKGSPLAINRAGE